jgi:hypothetical protein
MLKNSARNCTMRPSVMEVSLKSEKSTAFGNAGREAPREVRRKDARSVWPWRV